MTTVNMKDYVNGNVNENKAVQEVIGKIKATAICTIGEAKEIGKMLVEVEEK